MDTPGKPAAWLLTLAGSAGLAAYVALVLAPGQQSLARLRRDLREKQQLVDSVGEQAQSLAALEQQAAETVKHMERWRQAAPQGPNVVDFLGKLALLAGDAGVRINRLAPQPPVAMASLRQHRLALEIEGEYPQVVAFLGQVESLPETVWIRHLLLAPDRQDTATVQCELILTVFADNREISG